MLLYLARGKLAGVLIAAAMIQYPGQALAAQSQRAKSPLHPKEILAALQPSAIKQPSSAEPFGEFAVVVASGDVPSRWRLLESEIDAENDILDGCRTRQACPRAAEKLLDIIALGRKRQGLARIGAVNRAVNLAIAPVSDMKQWGVADHWSPPLETLTTLRGDCEDYAIVKYVALLSAGLAKDDVKLVIVKNKFPDEEHAVVAVRVDGGWRILDNRTHVLVPDIDMRGASPLFVLDDVGARIFVPGMSGIQPFNG